MLVYRKLYGLQQNWKNYICVNRFLCIVLYYFFQFNKTINYQFNFV